MIDIDGVIYKIDIDVLMAWVSETPSCEKNISTITTLNYPLSDEDIIEKEVSESKATLNDTMNNIRYDLIRNLINTLFTTLNDVVTYSLKDLTVGQKIAFNTLFAKNIIKEVKINKYEHRNVIPNSLRRRTRNGQCFDYIYKI